MYWQPALAPALIRVANQGIRCQHAKYPQKCQSCGKNISRFRRKCPICERFIAPNCEPKLCWSDELNHCRHCHAVIGTLKHIRFKIQYLPNDAETTEQEDQSNLISYKDFPIEVQVNIMIFVFQVKDFLWSPHRNRNCISTPMCRCPMCTRYRSQSLGGSSS